MLVFSKEKYLEHRRKSPLFNETFYNERETWVAKIDGKPVDDKLSGDLYKCGDYYVKENWCVEMEDTK